MQNVPGAAGTIGLSQFTDAQRGNGRALLVTGLVMVGATLWNDSPVSVNQATPIARLDAASDRVMELLHASMNIEPMLGGFYASLSDQQRRRFNAAVR